VAANLKAKRGFTLPLVLAMVAILAIALAAGLSALASLRDETRNTLAAAEFERQAATAEARMQFLMLTEPFGRKGLRIGGTRAPGSALPTATEYFDYLSQIVADGRGYRWQEAENGPVLQVRVQDEAGLVNFGQSDPTQISRLFQQVGLGSDNADQIASELVEYNAQPAPGQPIRRLAELYSLPDGKTLISDKVYRQVDALAAAHPDVTNMNINTAPRDVLKAWFGMSDSDLDQAIRNRDDADIGLASPLDLGVAGYADSANYRSSAGRLRFTFTDPKTKLTYRSTLVLTPNNRERPIWVENAKTTRLSKDPDPLTDDAEDFPQIAPSAS
jgi:type II secretory pathway pseudopilin PulG